MIVGNGMIAEAFSSYRAQTAVKIFAAGVSRSRETRISEFDRERNLLSSHLDDFCGCFIYFSSCSVHYLSAENPYVRHKLLIETEIRNRADQYLIFRLPQLVGRSNNPNTLTNYFHERITRGEQFKVFANATRSLLDVEHAYGICDRLISNPIFRNSMIDVCLPYAVPVISIVQALERILQRPARYDVVPGGEPFFCPPNGLDTFYADLDIKCDASYVETVLRKYYSQPKPS